jgi:hypothetical protein
MFSTHLYYLILHWEGSKSTWIKYASTVRKEEEQDGETIDKTFTLCKWLQMFNVDCLDDSEAEEKIQPLLEQKLGDLDKKISKNRDVYSKLDLN